MTDATEKLSRRGFIGVGAAALILPTVACSKTTPKKEQKESVGTEQTAMLVYRDPDCPCCMDWVTVARDAGFAVTVRNDPDMPARKSSLGVPEALASCHTTQVAGLVFEGHVPISHVRELIAKNEYGLAGLAVPGMPRGAPGMEMADGAKDAFEVIGFDKAGKTRVFAKA